MELAKNRVTITGILVFATLTAGIFTLIEQAAATHGPTLLVVDVDGMVAIVSSQPDCGATTSVDNITTFSSIQAAIDVAGGHTIIVCPGTYSAITVDSTDGIEKIYGLSGAIIDGGGAETVFIDGVNTGCVSPDRTVIHGFTIRGAITNNGVRVEDSCRIFVQFNTIGDIADPNARGILFQNTDHSWIEKNTVRNSTLEEGIKLELGSSNNAILGNTVFNNEGQGIEITSSSSDNLLTQNVVRDNGAGSGEPGFAGILVNSGTGNMLKRNNSRDNLGCEYELVAGTFVDRGRNKANGAVIPLVAGCNGTA